MATFIERLKTLRIENQVTQKQMGETLGVTDKYYQKIEYGTVGVSQERLIMLADFFDVSTDYLLGRTDDPKRY
ncbi:helix-turn-helix transcriptional regulator [Chakrabartyella piscis]|uniref:helix-turn-helix domain-containing protein n=1 Tax=Chakrabartyella piscis TaxID=2918914 RepID=UPI0029583773|nr:helix-turn-helix transcriptional regulator [Chakrabartyella piscis]